MAAEIDALEKISEETKKVGNPLVAEGKHQEALSVYLQGIAATRQRKAAYQQFDGTIVEYEPIPLLLNAAFCAASVALGKCAELATVNRDTREITMDPAVAAAPLVEIAMLLEDQRSTMDAMCAAFTQQGKDTAPNRFVIPKKFQVQETKAKAFFRSGQVYWALSRVRQLEALLLDPVESTIRTAATPLRLAVKALSCFRQCEAFGGEVVGTPNYADLRASLFAHCTFVEPCVDKFDSPVHGVGIRVAAAVTAGTLLVVERPTVMVKANVGSYEDRFIAAIEQVITLQKSKRGSAAHQILMSYLALHSDPTVDNLDQSKKVDADSAVDPEVLCDVWLRNSMRLSNIEYSLRERKEPTPLNRAVDGGAALYLDSSRFNHSCEPNAVAYFDLDALPRPSRSYGVIAEVNIVTLRDLEAGEEVFISYTGLVAPKHTKTNHLRFRCSCSRCTSNPDSAIELESVLCPVCSMPRAETIEDKEIDDEVETEKQSQMHVDAEGKGPTTVGNNNAVGGECQLCGHQINAEEHVSNVRNQIDDVIAAINRSSGADDEIETRVKCAKRLLRLSRISLLMGGKHYLRVQLFLEAASCVAGISIKRIGQELLQDLMDLSLKARDIVASVCPPNWPLLTGISMHSLYLIGRRHAAEVGEDNANAAVLLNFTASDSALGDELCRAFASHCILHAAIIGPEMRSTNSKEPVAKPCTELTTFLARYQDELNAIGVSTESDFSRLF